MACPRKIFIFLVQKIMIEKKKWRMYGYCMATHKERAMVFHEEVKKKPIALKGMFLGMNRKALFSCLVCEAEWEVEPRRVIGPRATGCRKCAYSEKRGGNLVLEKDGPFLKIDISIPSRPGAFMLINRKKWELLVREGIGRVSPSTKGYPWAMWKGRKQYVHRILMGFPKEVDHRNGVKWDNRTHNLREATSVQNQMNRGLRKTNKSGIIGVSRRSYGWESKLCVGRVVVHRGRHKTLEDAAAARAKAVAEHCGEFAPI